MEGLRTHERHGRFEVERVDQRGSPGGGLEEAVGGGTQEWTQVEQAFFSL